MPSGPSTGTASATWWWATGEPSNSHTYIQRSSRRRPEEEAAAKTLGLAFIPIRSGSDLRQLAVNVELGLA